MDTLAPSANDANANPMLRALADVRAFIIYRASDKSPISPAHPDPASSWANSNAQDRTTWMYPHEAQAWVAALGPGYGVGIVLHRELKIFCIDIDGALVNGEWSGLALDLFARFAGAAKEISLSGGGGHIFGSFTGDMPSHKSKNKTLHIELYHELRYIALTGSGLIGDVRMDCTHLLPHFIKEHFAPTDDSGVKGEWTTIPDVTPADFARAIEARRRESALFAALIEADTDVLTAKWSKATGECDQSEADFMLCCELLTLNGGNCEALLEYMRDGALALARPKWDKRYLRRTILRAFERISPSLPANIGFGKGPRPAGMLDAPPSRTSGVPPVPSAMPTLSEVSLVCAANIKPQAIKWLWDAHLPRGKLAILAGVPGNGKSTLAFNLAAIVSTGGAWPDGTRCPGSYNVLIWSGEDGVADTIVPRLIAAGADLRRIHIVYGRKSENGKQLPFDPAHDVPLVRDQITKIGGAGLLIVDPIVSVVAGDMHKANDVRHGLQGLIDLGADFDAAVLGISHFSKGSKGASPGERVIGSQAFVAASRLVMVCAKNEDSDTRVLMRAKSNISLDHGGFNYNIVPTVIPDPDDAANPIKVIKIEWGEALEGNAREILEEMEGDPERKDDKSAACAEAMRAILCGADGQPIEMLGTDVKSLLMAAGHSEKVIRIARKRLKVITQRDGFGPGSKGLWRLPASAIMVGPGFVSTL